MLQKIVAQAWRLYIKGQRVAWRRFASSTKGGLNSLGHINKACKVHTIIL